MKNYDALLAMLLLILVQATFAKSNDTALAVKKTTLSWSDNFECPQIPEATYTYTAKGWIDSSGNTIAQPFVKSTETINILSDYTGALEGEDIRLTFYVGPDATFKGTLPKFVGATVILQGTLEQEIPKPMNNSEVYVCSAGSMIFSYDGYSVDSGNHFYNAGTITFTGNVNMNPGVEFINYTDASLMVNGVSEDFGFQFNGTLVNYGKIYVNNGNMYLNSPSSVSNFCTIYVKNDFVVDDQLNNNGLLLVEGRLELDSGQILNSGIADFGALVIDNATGSGATFLGDGINSLMIVRTDAIIRNGGEVAQTRFYDMDDGGGFDTICETCKEDVVVVDELTIPETQVYVEQCGAGINAPSGTLTGRVYSDTNGNGIQDTGELGLENVLVTVTTVEGATKSTYTTSIGAWSLMALPIGEATVTISEASLRPGAVSTQGASLSTVSVTAGATNTGVNGYTIPNEIGKLTGRVYNDSNGNGTQDAGELGLEDVWVFIASEGQTRADVYTDANGDWEASLVASRAQINIVRETLPAGAFETERYPVLVDMVAAGTTSAGSAGYGISSEMVPLTGLIYNDSNGNGTQDTNEPGLDNVVVNIAPESGAPQQVITGSDGRWTFSSVPVGVVIVDIDDRTLPRGVLQTQGNDPSYITTVANANNAASVAGFYTPIGTLMGFIYYDDNRNGIQDGRDYVLESVPVIITDSYGISKQVMTGSDGIWSATVLEGVVTVDIDNATIPEGATVTIGEDPKEVTVVAGEETDTGAVGYSTRGPTRPLRGTVYEDSNGNGMQDDGEPGLGGVDIKITDAEGFVITATTTPRGGWDMYLILGETTIDVDETTLPEGATLTEGVAPVTVTVTLDNAEADRGAYGYAILPQIGFLEGVVYDDSNGNGIQDAGELGLENVIVNITDEQGTLQTVTTTATGLWDAALIAGIATINIEDDTLPEGARLTEGEDPKQVTINPEIKTNAGTIGYTTLPQLGILSGLVYADINGNGTQDDGEYGLPSISIAITDSQGTMQTVSTTTEGEWNAVLYEGEATITIDDTTLPIDAVLTAGEDSYEITAIGNSSVDAGVIGYRIPLETGGINGLVYFDENGNGTQDQEELGLADVVVSITAADDSFQTVITDETGVWSAVVTEGMALIAVDESTLSVEGGVLSEGGDPSLVNVIAGDDINGGVLGYTIPSEMGTLSGIVYSDLDGNGDQNNNEPGLVGVIIAITDSTGGIQTITTDGAGGWIVTLFEGETIVDIDNFTLPDRATQTEGIDSAIINVVANTNNDAGSAGFEIVSNNDPEVAIYNAVSPNGDGINDELVITGISSFYYTELMVFNRWSQLVYDTTNYGKNSNVFDGHGNNQEVLPSGTYMYIFKYRVTETSEEITKSGHLYLQR